MLQKLMRLLQERQQMKQRISRIERSARLMKPMRAQSKLKLKSIACSNEPCINKIHQFNKKAPQGAFLLATTSKSLWGSRFSGIPPVRAFAHRAQYSFLQNLFSCHYYFSPESDRSLLSPSACNPHIALRLLQAADAIL